MGGKALKETYTERKTTEQFNEIASKLLPILQKELDTELYIVKCFHTKETHGDMDILVKIDEKFHNKNIDLRKFVKETFSPNEIFYNGGVVSFDFDEFQIDLIPMRESNWDVAKTYFDYDPTGNIMGKVANSIRFSYKDVKGRLSYGFEGLYAVLYMKDSDKKLGEVRLSRNNGDIFVFLDYDYDRFLKGFETKQEIFEYSVDTDYFKRDRFLMENLSHKDRKRNRKRQTYHEFLAYVDENKIPDKPGRDFDGENWLDFIDLFFIDADLKPKLIKHREYEIIRKAVSEKFNGHIVMDEFPELQGKELGTWLGNFKLKYDNWTDFVLTHTKDEIIEEFKIFYNSREVEK